MSVTSAAGARGWSAPWTVATGASGSPRLSVTQRGSALTVWPQGDALVAARARPGDEFSAPAAIPGADAAAISADELALETDEDGNAVAAWREFDSSTLDPGMCCERLHAAAAPRGSAFGPAVQLDSQGETTSYDVDVDPLGAAAVAWNDAESAWIAEAPDFSTFGAPRRTVGNCGSGEVALTEYPGTADLLFTCEPRRRLRARTIRADGPGPARGVVPGGPVTAPMVASDREFEQVGVWLEGRYPRGPVSAGVRDVGDRFAARRLGTGTQQSALVPADIAVAPRGFGLVVLRRFGITGGPPRRVLAAARRPQAGVGPAFALRDSAPLAAPAGAAGDGGDGAVAWPALSGDRIVVTRGPGLRSRHGIRFRTPLSAKERKTCDRFAEDCPGVDVGVDRRGDILVVWRERDAIRAARYTAP